MSEASVYQGIRRYWKQQYNQAQRRQYGMFEQVKRSEYPAMRKGWEDAMLRSQRDCSDYAVLLNRFKAEGTDGKD